MNQNYYVYILRCADGSYYVGQTRDIVQRLQDHQMKKFGNNTYTAKRLPVELIFVKFFSSRAEAQRYEREIKKFSRERKERLILQKV